jgi:16S rRNA (cytidine1402-2'-O)-methyltransferase
LLHFIPTPIGNLEDISVRSLKLLAQSSLVFCEDTRVTKRLISLLKERNDLDFLEKEYISMHSHNEKALLEKLSPEILMQDVVYVSDAGMPAVSDPGCELVRYCHTHAIKYEVLPGANAALLAYAASGFCESQFLFFGFLPHKGNDRANALTKALNSGYVTILYESPHRIQKLVDELALKAPDRKIFLIKEATKMYERSFKGTSLEVQEELKMQNIKGEWVVVLNALKKEFGVITVEDVIALDIPKKQASKLIAKITGKSPKECYQELL